MDLQEWAEGLCQETHDIWEKEIRGRYAGWEAGFSVFYSPILPKPRLLFVGANPGGGSKDFDPGKPWSIPEEHEYLSATWKLALRMRTLLAGCNPDVLLPASVKTNLNFFRSSKQETLLPDAPDRVKERLQTYCKAKVLEIIRVLQPTVVLAEALGTYDELCEPLFGKTGYALRGEKGARIFCKVEGASTPSKMVGIVLPTGQGASRLTSGDWEKVGRLLANELRPLTP